MDQRQVGMLYLSGMYCTEMGMLVFVVSIKMNHEGPYYSPSVFFSDTPCRKGGTGSGDGVWTSSHGLECALCVVSAI